MKKRYSHSIFLKVIILVPLVAFSSGCSKFFDKQPLDAISDQTFWKTENDAQLALVGCYYVDMGGGWGGSDFWHTQSFFYLEMMAGNGSETNLRPDHVTDGTLTSTNDWTGSAWQNAYLKIAACNNFLAHIEAITMDASKKAMMIAEVRTIRAYEFFNLSLYFGDVPLVDHVLTVSEANSITRTPRAEVLAFAETDLKESYAALPATRPDSENGRITKGASLAILGRLQMYEKHWDDAAATYKMIMDSNAYSIDPQFEELFWESNELSKEIILSMQYQKGIFYNTVWQLLWTEEWGGWSDFHPYNEVVKDFECIDGKTIDESPLYDRDNPYDNRDPRLDYSIMINERTTFQGRTFVSTPFSASPDRIDKNPEWSGYSVNKFMDENFTGSLFNSGTNFTIIRYAEVLISYLESMLESGAVIDQALLDQTINKIRGRAAVQMPAVTTTDAVELMKIIRRERRVEFAYEGLRYYDILRWGIAAEELNRQFTGMKLTDDPSGYTAYPVDSEGYLIFQRRNFKKGINELWPIPQSEIDINKNLTQNTGY